MLMKIYVMAVVMSFVINVEAANLQIPAGKFGFDIQKIKQFESKEIKDAQNVASITQALEDVTINNKVYVPHFKPAGIRKKAARINKNSYQILLSIMEDKFNKHFI